MDRIDGLIDGRDRAFRDTPLDSVLAEFLPCFQRHESAGIGARAVERALVVVSRSP
jgi:hypothetical protein